ncbi:hypothetical protein D9M72_494330 [compost metagenome]
MEGVDVSRMVLRVVTGALREIRRKEIPAGVAGCRKEQHGQPRLREGQELPADPDAVRELHRAPERPVRMVPELVVVRRAG